MITGVKPGALVRMQPLGPWKRNKVANHGYLWIVEGCPTHFLTLRSIATGATCNPVWDGGLEAVDEGATTDG